MAKKITMEYIANKLGISKNTVSLALRNMPGVSMQTRKLVCNMAKQFGYEYKKNLRNNVLGKNSLHNNICLILSKDTASSEGFFSHIQYGIESEARKNNLNTILHCFDEKNEKFETPLSIKNNMVAGIVTLGKVSKKTASNIIKLNLPLVMIDHYFDDLKSDYVLTDNQSGGYLAAEHLIKLGHRNIGFSGNTNASNSFFDRFEGFKKAIKDHGFTLDESLCITQKSMAELINNGVEAVVLELKKLPKLPSAFFCCNDIEAVSVIKALTAMGISVPKDISVIGFDNIESSRSFFPELTTMHISKERMGERAVKKLVSKIKNEESFQEKILMPATLVVRQSTAVLKNA
ncbi:MAG: LacI family DNA-binding transcriptional regulator [Bacillota bacterium]